MVDAEDLLHDDEAAARLARRFRPVGRQLESVFRRQRDRFTHGRSPFAIILSP
jgi:hypothetical protein